MIENSDRGVTLSKPLAWSMLSALVIGGIWIGTVVTDARKGVENLGQRQVEDRADIADNRNAISGLRSSNARIDQRLLNIESGVERTEQSISEILRYLREGGK